MKEKKRIVIIGGSSAIAGHCARFWLTKQPCDLILVGRDTQRIERVAADLKVRSPQSEIRVLEGNFFDAEAINATVNNIVRQGFVDIALIAHGMLPDQFSCQNDLTRCRSALEINGLSPVLYAEAFAKEMEKANHGTVVLISSVAGDRGRKSNYVYGAAKGLVTRYAEGLQHRFASSGVNVVLVKPGPTKTPMTTHLSRSGVALAPVENVAKRIVLAVDKGKSIVYTPGKWRLIMMIIRHLPEFIFNRVNI